MTQWSPELKKWLEDQKEHGYTEGQEEYNEIKDDSTEQKYDIVKHPRHYNRDNAMECIDEMELIYGTEAVMWFCLLSQHKYRYRAGLKDNGFQDLEKSDWYMARYKEYKEKSNVQKSYFINRDNTTIGSDQQITIKPYN